MIFSSESNRIETNRLTPFRKPPYFLTFDYISIIRKQIKFDNPYFYLFQRVFIVKPHTTITMSSSENKTPSATNPDAKNEKNDSSSTTTAMTMTTNNKPEAMEAIEEDDEFEEFKDANWGAGEEDAEDTQQWQDNWDVDDMDDDFTKNLREELMKNSQ